VSASGEGRGTNHSGVSLAELLTLVEKFGTVVVSARSLEKLAPVDARAALHVAGVILPAPAAPTWPCDVRGCSREVRANYDGARKPLVAICCQAPPVCSPVELAFDDVAQQEVSVEALVVAACTLLGAAIDRASLAKVRERRPLGEARAPILVATLAESRTDVLWASSPRDTDLALWCARRERIERKTLVLVPTTNHVPFEVASRFARGEQVEVRALDDLLEARDGRLALRADAAAPPPPTAQPTALPTAPGIAALLGATRWEEIRITVIDGHTVRIEANGKSILRTFVELGFVDGRKRDVVTPTTAWPLLLLFLKKGGRIKPSAYAEHGKAFAVKKAVERLGVAMRQSFGLAEHPIHAYSKRAHLWAARFLVAE
jgi:hypothetical protein